MAQEQEQEQQTTQAPRSSKLPRLPKWPTSRPGPQVTEPLPGQKRLGKRTEQVVEVGYNQETGEPGLRVPARSELDELIAGPVSTEQEKDIQQVKETEKVQ
jgi:hypothetical protein